MDTGYDLSRNLPEELDITDRSRRFWEGKYKVDDAGFTDDDGVYRAFDCYVEEARAPTPLPPIYLMKCVREDGEEALSVEATITEAPVRIQSASSMSTPATNQVKTSSKPSSKDDKSSSTCSLSDCPSDLSDWEVSDKTKKKQNATRVKDEEEEIKTEESKTKQAPKRNTTTRGVAQKVTKSAKAKKEKAAAAAAAPVVLQRQTGRGTARRRSGR